MNKKQRQQRMVANTLESIKIENGDIILVKANTRAHQLINQIAQHMGKTGRQDCLVIVVDDFKDLRRVPQENMENYGWVKIQEEA